MTSWTKEAFPFLTLQSSRWETDISPPQISIERQNRFMSKSVSPVIIAAHEVSARFGEQVVLKKATLNVHQRDRIGLIGNNGSGKSTLLKIIAGILPPDSGTVSRGKEVVTGYLPQDFQLDNSKSVYNNIVEGAHDVIDTLRE